jgi:hypothetical protein
VEIELANCGTRPEYLVRDAEDVPELRQRMKLLSSFEAKLRLALDWFGDQGHPQPEKRTRPATASFDDYVVYGDPTPDWRRLPRLDETGQPKARKPRHRPPAPVPETKIKQLKWELAQRKRRPGDRELTQEKIAGRLGLGRMRIQQAEALERAGWDLLRSHPEFSAKDDFVRWPSASEAVRILASERAEN